MEQKQINLSELERMFDELAQQNWTSSTQFLSQEFCRSLAQECQNLYDNGSFRQASIGRGATKVTHTEIRGDSILWIDEKNATPLQAEMLSILQTLLQRLNQSFYLGLKRFETHFAWYPPGASYDKHIDNHRGSGARKITFILYLNEAWQKEHGGELSLYHPENESKLLARIEPQLGTFVLFRSDLFPHQVEKSFANRLSITGWFRDDAS
ncbi:2OG-Fe(II) oxygenase [Bdellovibrio bacteriovorus]|uniref:2OG-Fe(II) oxygenase n=1 Tax=Bdellovibrio bacteriovorus TaxID=959 RepID=UPI0035A6608E